MNDKVSIIIPYYKKKFFFLKTLKSVINQTYKNFEIIIVYDDPSRTDLEYIKDIIKFNKKITLLTNKENLGAGYSRNVGIKYSKGRYIAFLDADDVWHSKKLATQMKFMKKYNVNFSHTSYKIIDEKDKSIGKQMAKPYISYLDLLKSCDIGLSTVLIKKKILKKKMFSKLKTKEDYSLWLKLAKNNKILGMNKFLCKWRRSDNSLSSSASQRVLDAFLVYFKEENLNFFISIFRVFILSYFSFLKRIKQRIYS
jgi:teichuronic acid biosynthesis glycosyltransferase TuaG